MESVHPLRELFDHLATRVTDVGDGTGGMGGMDGMDGGGPLDPRAALDAAGHGGLPAELVAEALVNYAATAPAEVAESLAPFVIAHSGVPAEDGDPTDAVEPPSVADGFALLTGVAPAVGPDPIEGLGPDTSALDGLSPDGLAPEDAAPSAQDPPADDETTDPQDDPFDLEFDVEFGTGTPADVAVADSLDWPDPADAPDQHPADPEEPTADDEALPDFGAGWSPEADGIDPTGQDHRADGLDGGDLDQGDDDLGLDV
jgi:hypothetical protein